MDGTRFVKHTHTIPFSLGIVACLLRSRRFMVSERKVNDARWRHVALAKLPPVRPPIRLVLVYAHGLYRRPRAPAAAHLTLQDVEEPLQHRRHRAAYARAP